jgi:hypothetical protein
MPRHPPFALRNLKSHEFRSNSCNTPKGAAKLTSEHAKQHPRKDADSRDSPFVKQPKGLLLRCSRPLCSSQQTARTPTPTSNAGFGEGLQETITPTPERAGLSGPSGPNSVHVPASPDHTVPTPRKERTEHSRNQPAPMSMFHP